MKTNIVLRGFIVAFTMSLFMACEQDSVSETEKVENVILTEESLLEKAFPEETIGELLDINYLGQEVTVEKIEEHYIFEGDIKMIPDTKNSILKSTGRTQGRWPNNTVYYAIESGLPNQARVTDAIAHWESNSSLRFIPRTSQSDYVYFKNGGGCSSFVGRIGGRQDITLANACSTGNTIHEIGHAIGLWHEQSRKDRDQYVTINFQNILAGREHNFQTYIQRGHDGDEYSATLDFGSIMMYGPNAFSKNGQPTIMRLNGSTYSVQRTALSAADIAGINRMYPGNLILRRWATRQGGFWDAQKWLSGDFNGDGKDDYAKVFKDGTQASIDVHISNSTSFTMRRWATKQGGFWDAQKWVTGDFNGDGKDDFAKVFNDGGKASIDVHLSTGTGFIMKRWATKQGGYWDAQKWVTGDFNGDGKDDFAKSFKDSGKASIDVHISSGSSFTLRRWATQQGGFWDAQKWMTGDFNGDGKDDFAKVFKDNNSASIDVHLSTGAGFTMRRWATRQGGYWDTQKWMTGDFNGDGKHDFSKAFKDNNLATIDVHLSNGSSFGMSRWINRQGGYWDAQKWTTGDFNGDGTDDFTKSFKDNNLASIDVHISK
ncbi:M12 family metallopeptidase [Aquimarina sp. RZ0]|uniref:M12 family metallopeptidase n=1 Tax=Aquimarina sp. RZ0 TaxID=2607730 RepID=UPI002103F705|nr:M12 family metallopeptidase [Aquimarina sp. RZ0]